MFSFEGKEYVLFSRLINTPVLINLDILFHNNILNSKTMCSSHRGENIYISINTNSNRTNDVFVFFVTGPYDSPPGEDIENTPATPSSIDPKTQAVNSKQNGIYYRYNIARLPDNSPVGIDYINWGKPKELMNTIWTLSSNWANKTGEYYETTPADYYLTLPDTMTTEWAKEYFTI